MNVDLFGNEITPPDEVKKMRGAEMAHKKLIMMHGISDGNNCKNCEYLHRIGNSKTYLKCEKFRMSNSESSDWRAGWQACGLFIKE